MKRLTDAVIKTTKVNNAEVKILELRRQQLGLVNDDGSVVLFTTQPKYSSDTYYKYELYPYPNVFVDFEKNHVIYGSLICPLSYDD